MWKVKCLLKKFHIFNILGEFLLYTLQDDRFICDIVVLMENSFVFENLWNWLNCTRGDTKKQNSRMLSISEKNEGE